MSEDKIIEKKYLLHLLELNKLDVPFMIQEAFLAYRYRKRNKSLYDDDAVIPTKLIRMYYELKPGEIEFDAMKKNFIKKYVLNESKIEGVNDEDIHGHEEVLGLADLRSMLVFFAVGTNPIFISGEISRKRSRTASASSSLLKIRLANSSSSCIRIRR